MNDIRNITDLGPDSDVVDRVKHLMRVLNMKQINFAAKVGVDPATISRIVKRVIPPSEGLINKIVIALGVSKKWLQDGTGNIFSDNLNMMKVIRPMGAPVYNIDVTAGAIPLSRMFTEERIVGYVNLPGINPDLPIVRVSGDSMVPKIQNGAYLAIRHMNPDAPIAWGQIYVVILADYRVVKFVRRHPNPEKVILHSANDAYDDIEINRSDIEGLYLVENIINHDFVC
ncbi:MAG: helix-turn-helix domain-containing protein [Muribaculaceae bacterium]|nr:helix-turn-helix domain-containing protein [Muribaculaceae bacterium]